jgi:hypothetical protein
MEPSLSVIQDQMLDRFLTGLHARSDAQIAAWRTFEAQSATQANPPTEQEIKRFRSDKFVALDRDKLNSAISSAAPQMRGASSRSARHTAS